MKYMQLSFKLISVSNLFMILSKKDENIVFHLIRNMKRVIIFVIDINRNDVLIED